MFLSFIARRIGRALGIKPSVVRVIETAMNAGLVILLGLGTGILAARMLGPDGRGELASILLGLQVSSQMAILGLKNASIYNIRQFPAETPTLVGGSYILTFLGSALCIVVGWVVIPYWLDDYSPAVIEAAKFAMLITPIWALMLIAVAVMRAHNEFTIFLATRVLTPTLTVTCLLVLFLAGNDSPIAAAAPYVLSCCVFLPWSMWWIGRHCHPRLRGSAGSMRKLLQYGSRSAGIDAVNVLSRFLDRLIIVYLLAPSAIGLYVVAVNMARPLNELGTAITLVLFPKASSHEPEEAIALSGLAARLGLFAMAAIGAVLIVIAPILLGLCFGAEFVAAVAVFRWIVLAVILSATGDILALAFTATGRPGTVSILRCIEIAILGGLLLWLVPAYGMVGAAWAITAVAAFRFVGVLVSFPLILGIWPPRLYITPHDLKRIRNVRAATPSNTQGKTGR